MKLIELKYLPIIKWNEKTSKLRNTYLVKHKLNLRIEGYKYKNDIMKELTFKYF